MSLSSSQRFVGKNILVTGAACGQGADEARTLVEEGAFVLITDVQDREGEALAASLGSSAQYLHLDVSNEEHWNGAVKMLERRGGLHGLVNNAAIYIPKPLMETSPAEFNKHMQINQFGAFLGMRAAVPLMERAGGGSIVNISSSAGLRGSPRALAYCATKWALRGMTKAVAIDLGPRNIRVNSVHPGPIDTAMISVLSEQRLKERIATVPLKRIGRVDDVTKLVLFLLSNESAYMTGAEVAVDGGVTL